MQLKLIEEFQVFAKWMNFTNAATELGLTQSNLSKHMAQLEREVGATLIGRSGVDMFLTPAGKLFLEESSLFLAGYADMVRRCQAIDKLPETRLVFQEQLQNPAMFSLYSAAKEYQSECVDENVIISFVVLQRSNPVTALKKGRLDVGISLRCMPERQHIEALEKEGLCVAPMAYEPMIAWLAKDNPLLESGAELSLEDFYQVPIMTTAGDVYDYIGDAVRDLFARNGRIPRFRTIVQDKHWGLSDYFMTKLGDSVLFTTFGAVSDVRLGMRDDIVHVSIGDERMQLSSVIIALKENDPARRFVEFARGRKPGTGSIPGQNGE